MEEKFKTFNELVHEITNSHTLPSVCIYKGIRLLYQSVLETEPEQASAFFLRTLKTLANIYYEDDEIWNMLLDMILQKRIKINPHETFVPPQLRRKFVSKEWLEKAEFSENDYRQTVVKWFLAADIAKD